MLLEKVIMVLLDQTITSIQLKKVNDPDQASSPETNTTETKI
jgi:hypothetical protein